MRIVSTLTAVSLLLLPACGSEAASPVGTYTVTIDIPKIDIPKIDIPKIDIPGMPADAAAMMGEAMNAVTWGDMHLRADGTWDTSMEMELLGQKRTTTMKGTWELDGDEIVLTATEENGAEMAEPDVQRGKYVDGSFSLMSEGPGGDSIKMDMKKKDS